MNPIEEAVELIERVFAGRGLVLGEDGAWYVVGCPTGRHKLAIKWCVPFLGVFGGGEDEPWLVYNIDPMDVRQRIVSQANGIVDGAEALCKAEREAQGVSLPW